MKNKQKNNNNTEGRDTESSSWKTNNRNKTCYEVVMVVSYSKAKKTHIQLVQKLQTKGDPVGGLVFSQNYSYCCHSII